MIGFIRKLLADERFWRLFRYGVVGVLTTAVSFGSFWLLNFIGVETNLSNAISILLAVTFAYVTNKLFVFRSHCSDINALVREVFAFFAARGVSMLVEILGVFLLYSVLHIHELVSKAAAGVIVLILNYFFSVFLFKKGRRNKNPAE